MDCPSPTASAALPLKLAVDETRVESAALDGRTLAPGRFTLDERYLTLDGVPDNFSLTTTCVAQLESADNMTDALAALTALANCDCLERRPALDAFYATWKDEPLVVDKWLEVEALSRVPGTAARVQELTAHASFTLTNPNKVYALLGSFGANQLHFHAPDGERRQRRHRHRGSRQRRARNVLAAARRCGQQQATTSG